VLPSLGSDAQSFHHAHHRDLVPGIAASWRLDAVIKSFGGKKQIFGMKSQERSSILF
jgi:hypothetical protein